MQLTTTLGDDVLLFKRLRAKEGLSQLFRYELEILRESTEVVEPSTVLGQPMVVKAGPTLESPNVVRYFHGICVDFSQGNWTGHFTKYRAELVPAQWILTQITQSRIFQQKSVPDILRIVFEAFNVKFELQGTFEPRNYCVQYRESDWDFASRLMEEEGIFYFFKHTASEHQMIVANTVQSHPDCPTRSTFPFTTDISSLADDWAGSVLTWRVDNRLRTGKYTVWDHNFQLPDKSLEATGLSRFTVGQNNKLEIYDYPGEYAKRFDGIDPSGGERSSDLQKVFDDRQRTVQIRQQEIDVAYKNIYATSDAFPLTAGHKFELSNHGDNNGSYVLVSLQIEAVQSPSYSTDDPVGNPYLASFACIPKKSDAAPFRPLRKTPKAVIHGTQTAVVVGPPGEEIFTDKYGRVKVQFHWDRQGKKNSDSSCWIRVATPWAGKQWGTLHIPRVGMEVVVNFMDGDPDQPIIVGSVYNPNTMPPYTLPDNKTQSTLKSSSSKGGSGFNEMRFEDKAGAEQIFIHAQRDHETRILRDAKESIERDRHLTIERDQFELVKRDKHLIVKGDRKEKVDGAVSLKVGTSMDVKAGTKLAAEAGTEIHLKAGTTAVIEAGVSLTLKVGGNFININPAGVFIKGTMVMINSGGAGGNGSGSSPETPTDAQESEKGESGQKVNAESASPAPPPPPPQFASLAAAVRSAPPDAPPGAVEEAVREAVNSHPEIPAPIEGPVAAAVEDARAAVAQYSEPELAAAVESARSEAAPIIAAAQTRADEVKSAGQSVASDVKAAVDEAKAHADEAKARIEQAAAAYQEAREKVDEAKTLVAAYESEIKEVGEQAMSLLNAADNASPFSGL